MPNPESDQHLVEHPIAETTLHRGWLELRHDEVRLPDGTSTGREYIQHGGAVAVVALLDDEHLVVVRQYRYPVRKVLLELPAGKLDPGESQLACGIRELREETGYSAAEWAYGGELHNAAAYSTESIWLWFARGLTAGEIALDAGEFVETRTMAVAELQALASGAGLPDVKTQVGLAWLLQWRAGQRPLQWQSVAGQAGL